MIWNFKFIVQAINHFIACFKMQIEMLLLSIVEDIMLKVGVQQT